MTRLVGYLLWKELYELARQPLVALGAFLVPLYLLYVSSTFLQEDSAARVVVMLLQDDPSFESVIQDLAGLDGLRPIFVDSGKGINALMAEHEARLGLTFSEEGQPVFVERSTMRLERRMNFDLALRIKGALDGVDPRLTAAIDTYLGGTAPDIDVLHAPLLEGSDRRVFVPGMLALVAVLLATVLGARSVLRELEYRTLPLLVSLPRSGLSLVALAKTGFVALFCTAVLCFLILTMPTAFDFLIKPGVVGILGAHALAVVASAAIGACLAFLSRGVIEAYLAVSVYLIANIIVLTGFVAPIYELNGDAGSVINVLFPLTYLRPILEGWLFFGDPVTWRQRNLLALAAHAAAAIALLLAVTSRHEIRS